VSEPLGHRRDGFLGTASENTLKRRTHPSSGFAFTLSQTSKISSQFSLVRFSSVAFAKDTVNDHATSGRQETYRQPRQTYCTFLETFLRTPTQGMPKATRQGRLRAATKKGGQTNEISAPALGAKTLLRSRLS